MTTLRLSALKMTGGMSLTRIVVQRKTPTCGERLSLVAATGIEPVTLGL